MSSAGYLNEDALAQAKDALAQKDDVELKGMAGRLEKSLTSLEEMLQDLQAERSELQKEKTHLNDTIGLMMGEVQKLRIGQYNTIEPELDEGPLDFIGRFWETVKPRDTAYMASDHVGEIKKPVVDRQDSVSQSLQDAQDLGRNAADTISNVFEAARSSSFWDTANTFLRETRQEMASAVASLSSQDASHSPWMMTPGDDPTTMLGMDWAAPDTKTEAHSGRKHHRDRKGGAVGRAYKDAYQHAATDASIPSSSSSGFENPKPIPVPVPPLCASLAPETAVVAPENSAAPSSNKASESATSGNDVASTGGTVLIEAHIKIGDGSVQTLLVRSADRCKDVAERFINEHSLKDSFAKLLTVHLKKVESDTEQFPAKVEVDLMELAACSH